MESIPTWELLKERIELFILNLRHPVLLEPARELLDLSTSSYSLSTEYNKLLFQVWNEHIHFVRHITGIRHEKPGRMELQFQKFGKGPPGTLILAESRAAVEQVERRSQRLRYAKTLRRILGQLFPGWTVEECSAAPDLTHSLSGRYARGLLSLGQRAWAFIGCGEEEASAEEEILTYGVIWLDWLRQNRRDKVVQGLKLFVPGQRGRATLHRLHWMDSEIARWEFYETAEKVQRLDVSDAGNWRTRLAPLRQPQPATTSGWSERIEALSDAIDVGYDGAGWRSWSVLGLPVAHETPRGVVFGIGRSETLLGESTLAELETLVQKLIRYRSPRSEDRQHPYYRLLPERWMERMFCRDMARLGLELVLGAIHEQTPAVWGAERGVIDLLAINSQGRLAVIELKASEDVHLPLQALDYWMCVRAYQERGQLERYRTFGNRPVSPEPPLLLLVSPALQFHPACEVVMRYFSKEIEVVRLGLNENWREGLQVVFRESRPARRTSISLGAGPNSP